MVDNDIYYIIHINADMVDGNMCATICWPTFCAKVLDISNGTIKFQLHGSEALVILPYSYIKWMAPSSVLGEKLYDNR